MIQGLLEGELEEELGYSKYDYHDKETDNSRNGFSKKTVRSSSGNIDLDIPRDHNGEFEPQVVKKHQRDVSNIEDQVLSMYAKGMTTRDISSYLWMDSVDSVMPFMQFTHKQRCNAVLYTRFVTPQSLFHIRI